MAIHLIYHTKFRKWGVEIISHLFILLFVYAAVSKLIDHNNFYNNLRNSPLLGKEEISSMISWILPVMELLTVLCLAWSKARLKGIYMALGLFILYTAYVGGILFLAPYEPCSCGGVVTLLSWNEYLVLNTLFLLLAVLAIIMEKKKYT